MRKDLMADNSADFQDETDFVEGYWTKVWEQEGGPQGRLEKIPRNAEYKIMAPFLAELPKGSRILDGGCGLGDWTLHLQSIGFSTVGLDLSRKTIQQLRARFPEAEFIDGDIRETKFSDESLDAYFSWGVFEHFENGPQDCVREAYRILKPGGLLFVSVPFDNLRQSVRSIFSRPGKEPCNLRFYQWRFTRAELAAELFRFGFKVIDVEPIHKRQGILRCLHHEFKLPYNWFLTKALSAVLAPFVPGVLVAHMVLAVARKPLNSARI